MTQPTWQEFALRSEEASKEWQKLHRSLEKDRARWQRKGSASALREVLQTALPQDKWWGKLIALSLRKQTTPSPKASASSRAFSYPRGKKLLGRIGEWFEKRKSRSASSEKTASTHSSETSALWENRLAIVSPIVLGIGVPLLRMWIKKQFPATRKFL